MNPIEAIAAAAQTEIEIAPLRFRIRRVNSALLQRAGRTGLAMIPHTPEALEAFGEMVKAAGEKRAPDPEAEKALARAIAEQIANATPETWEAEAADRAAVIAAGVLAVAVTHDEGTDAEGRPTWVKREGAPVWGDVRILTNGVAPNPAAGELHVDQLPPGVERRLADEIVRHTNDGTGAAKRIAAFRG